MHNLLWTSIVVAAGSELAWSALPDAPVVPDRPRRGSRWLRPFAERRQAA